MSCNSYLTLSYFKRASCTYLIYVCLFIILPMKSASFIIHTCRFSCLFRAFIIRDKRNLESEEGRRGSEMGWEEEREGPVLLDMWLC